MDFVPGGEKPLSMRMPWGYVFGKFKSSIALAQEMGGLAIFRLHSHTVTENVNNSKERSNTTWCPRVWYMQSLLAIDKNAYRTISADKQTYFITSVHVAVQLLWLPIAIVWLLRAGAMEKPASAPQLTIVI
jgi:hypothetical protein